MNEYMFSDIKIGLEASFDVTIDSSKMSMFLEICNDTNPLHICGEYARSKGFSEKVVHGLLTSSFYSTLVGVHLPGKYCVLHGIDIKFIQPVYIQDKLAVSGKVKYINEAYRQIEIRALIVNQHGKKVSTATIRVGVKDE